VVLEGAARAGLRASLLGAGLMATAWSSSSATAADGPAAAPADTTTGSDVLDEVTVTGIRAGIDAAITLKRKDDNIIEAVSAEDIGKLPDTSIAESLARLPGLTTQRSDGRDSDISIRGFSSDFNGTLLNGREQVSTGDNRAIQFDQYPAELVSGVVVYKTPDAALVGQGLAGTIDMRTTRPLEYGHRTLVFDVRGIKNGNGDLGADSTDKQYRASFSYVDQYFDNTLGVTFGFARLDTPVDTKETGVYDPWQANCAPNTQNLCLTGVPTNVFVTGGIKSLASTGIDKRDGTIFTAEWRPIDRFTSTFDLYYTDRELDNNRRSLEVNLGNYNGFQGDAGKATYSNLNIVNNSLIGATVGNVVPLARNFLYQTHDQIFATGWNNKLDVGGWTFTSDLGYSRAERDEHDYETQAQYTGGVTDTVNFNLPSSSGPTFSAANQYTNPAQVLIGPTIYGAGYSRFPHVVDELKTVRFDVSRSLDGWFSAAMAGINYDDRTKNKRQPEASLNTIANADGGYYQVGSQYLLPSTNLGFSGTPSSLSWNVPGVLNAYFQPINASTDGNSSLVGKTWEVDEKLTTAYVMGNLSHDLSADVKLRGNVGVQFVHTQQSSSSQYWYGPTNTPVPISGGTSYNDVLPSANLVFELPQQQDLRVGLARELIRPRMDQMANSFEYGVSQTSGVPSATGGNPDLSPWRASAAAFYKKLTSYIYTINETYDFSTLNAGLPPGYLQPGVPLQSQGLFTTFLNGSGGRVDGVEFSASLPGELITDYLSGFGLLASISETESSITIPGTVSGIPSSNVTLPGLSKTVWQATVYYEKHGFSARIATHYRSNYVGEITDYAGDRALEYVRHEQLTDFQTGYDFQEGRLKGLSLIFQIDNMTNAPFIDYAGTESRVRDYETYGRVFFLGAKYKL
jgi:TonB-dependent receptor